MTRTRGTRRLHGTTAAVAVALTAIAGSVSAAVGVRADEVRALYVNEVLSLVKHAALLGPTDPQTPITVGVMISHPDPAGEDRYIHDEYTPGTAAYRKWLTPQQFQQRFGVSPQSQSAVMQWLHSANLRVDTIAGSTDYALATGSAAALGNLLQVHFNQYGSSAGAFRANDRAPSAPASLHIFGFTGLDTVQRPRLNTYSPANHPVMEPRTGATPAIGPGTTTGLSTPQVLWQVYGQPDVNKGEGQTMAIFGWGVTDGVERDLRLEEKEFKLPATPFQASHYGPEKIDDVGGLGEWDLDTQASSGMAPNTQGLKLYFGAAGTDPDIIAAYKAWANDPQGPLQGNSSFGGCEEAPGTDMFSGGPGNPSGVIIIANASQDLYDSALKQAVAEGRTMFASTGDTGSSCPVIAPVTLNGITNEAVPLLGYPAASQYAVAVGGTILYYDGDGSAANPASRALEYAWPYTGGGTSAFIAAPSFQAGVLGIVGHCVSDPHGNAYSTPAPLCRGIPDVTAQSGDFQFGTGAAPNGYTITSGGSTDQPGGGTSLSSPLWLGMWTRVQAASASGTGFANPLLYQLGSDSNKSATDFNDILVGANGYYTAHPGWDYVSGFGSPNVTGIMGDVNNGNLKPVNNLAPPPVVTVVPDLPAHINPCGPLFAGTAGSDSLNVPFVGATPVEKGSNPQLNVLAGDMSLSDDGKTLITTLTINNLNKTLPPGGQANQYYLDWTFKGASYYSVVQVDSSGTVTFNDGELVSAGDPQGRRPGRTTRGAADTGSFIEGPNGKVVVNVPLSAIGSPKQGDVLSQPKANIQESERNILPTYDTAGPKYDFQIGEVCPQANANAQSANPVSNSATSGSGGNEIHALPNTSAANASPAAPAAAAVVVMGGVIAVRRRRTPRVLS